ncbi:M14 family zinc carboxypeptidase [uncultured Xylophilus sp.]|uniref:M14 family zinc carboxypeptidase n=1 Tax=uncultured Xylophilus sp. TaxID=296832 RepID=UPI0025D939A4|nr:M14 family zinc carboxypeptidase [uncultured Xylophilus sp.]
MSRDRLLRPVRRAAADHAGRPSRWALAALPLALLAACSSTPLPTWDNGATTRPATVAQPARVVPSAPPVVNMPPPGAVTMPVSPRPGTVVPAAPAVQAEPALPYSAAVAARFPDPATVYTTPGLAPGRTTFTTTAEMRQWLQDQVAAAARSPTVRAALVPIGTSQRAEPLDALVLTQSANTEASTLLADGRPTVLLIGQQHGDEPAGAEALLVIAREVAQGLLTPVLSRINVIVVPRANPDGAAAGTRVTANGIDMNRDHLLLKTPEALALARLVRDYKPTVVVDAHEYTVAGRFVQKFNAVQRFDGLLQYATTANLPEFVTKASEEWFRRPLVASLQKQSLTSEWYYTTSTDPNDLRVSMGGTQPDTGRNVNGLKNTVSVLLETRGVGIGRLHIQRRVHTHVVAATSVLQSTVARAEDLKQLKSFVDRDVSALACRADAVVEAAPTPTRRALLMLDPVTGADRSVDVEWNSALELRNVKTRRRPCGYWLDASSTAAVDKLRAAGVQVLRVSESSSLLMDSYRETMRSEGARQDVRGTVADGPAAGTVGGGIVKVEVALTRSLVDVPIGSYYVPLSQPLGNLIVAALEPDTQNSFFANRVIDRLESVGRVATVPTLRYEEVAP